MSFRHRFNRLRYRLQPILRPFLSWFKTEREPDIPLTLTAEQIRGVLKIVEVSDSAIEQFIAKQHRDLAMDISTILDSSICAVGNDWRVFPREMLESLVKPLQRAQVILSNINEKRDTIVFTLELPKSAPRRYAMNLVPDDNPVEEYLMAVLTEIGTQFSLFALRPLLGSDTYMHVLFTKDDIGKLKQILNDEFSKLFELVTAPANNRVRLTLA